MDKQVLFVIGNDRKAVERFIELLRIEKNRSIECIKGSEIITSVYKSLTRTQLEEELISGSETGIYNRSYSVDNIIFRRVQNSICNTIVVSDFPTTVTHIMMFKDFIGRYQIINFTKDPLDAMIDFVDVCADYNTARAVSYEFRQNANELAAFCDKYDIKYTTFINIKDDVNNLVGMYV